MDYRELNKSIEISVYFLPLPDDHLAVAPIFTILGLSQNSGKLLVTFHTSESTLFPLKHLVPNLEYSTGNWHSELRNSPNHSPNYYMYLYMVLKCLFAKTILH